MVTVRLRLTTNGNIHLTLKPVSNPAGIYLFKVKYGNTKTMCEICSKLKITTLERRHDVILVSLMLTLNRFHALF